MSCGEPGNHVGYHRLQRSLCEADWRVHASASIPFLFETYQSFSSASVLLTSRRRIAWGSRTAVASQLSGRLQGFISLSRPSLFIPFGRFSVRSQAEERSCARCARAIFSSRQRGQRRHTCITRRRCKCSATMCCHGTTVASLARVFPLLSHAPFSQANFACIVFASTCSLPVPHWLLVAVRSSRGHDGRAHPPVQGAVLGTARTYERKEAKRSGAYGSSFRVRRAPLVVTLRSGTGCVYVTPRRVGRVPSGQQGFDGTREWDNNR
eukprot:6183676-Pleurochrysis_carterae.AAC.3